MKWLELNKLPLTFKIQLMCTKDASTVTRLPMSTLTCRISLRALGKDRVKETKRLRQKWHSSSPPLLHHTSITFSKSFRSNPLTQLCTCTLKPRAFLTTAGAGCFMPTWQNFRSWEVHQLLATVPPSSTASLHVDLLWPRVSNHLITQRDLLITSQKILDS